MCKNRIWVADTRRWRSGGAGSACPRARGACPSRFLRRLSRSSSEHETIPGLDPRAAAHTLRPRRSDPPRPDAAGTRPTGLGRGPGRPFRRVQRAVHRRPRFAHGVGTHAPARAVVRLDGRPTRFQARVGLNDTGRREPGSVEFLVLGDEQSLFRSGVMRGGDPARPVDLMITGVTAVTLQVTDGGDHNHSDHAVWADAVVHVRRHCPARPGGSEPGPRRRSPLSHCGRPQAVARPHHVLHRSSPRRRHPGRHQPRRTLAVLHTAQPSCGWPRATRSTFSRAPSSTR
jgi:hypothetical protein